MFSLPSENKVVAQNNKLGWVFFKQKEEGFIFSGMS